MRLSFPSLGQIESNSTAETLALHQMRLHDKKATALIEISVDGSQQILMHYAHGIQAGIYRTDGNECKHITAADLDSIWRGGSKAMRVIPLPDKAGRLAWLTCESTKRATVHGLNKNTWTQQLRAWKLEGASGLAELKAETAHGFFQLRGGDPIQSETIVLYTDGKVLPSFELADVDTTWEANVFNIDPTGKAAQCVTLRQAASQWIRAGFESYQNISGEKFLMVMVRELQAQVRPWNWNITIEQNGMRDEHFFPGAEAAALAYRAILMGMGAQMSFAIGSYLTQRILTEMFNELEKEERASLESHRLIPAAFS